MTAATALGTTLLAASIVAASGPEWGEPCDAGNVPGIATPVTGPDGVNVESIVGQLTSCSDGGDYQDMFIIEIVAPVTAFSACVDPFDSDFDTQIWLFRFDTESGIIGNDEDPTTGGPNSCMGSAADDGSGFMVTSPGLHYLAISGFDSDPTSVAGIIFDQVSRFEVSGADGPGGSTPVSDWAPATGRQGRYTIDLTGVVFIDCPADFDFNGYVDFADLLMLLSAWGPCAVCPEDIDENGEVEVRDLVILLSMWGRCV